MNGSTSATIEADATKKAKRTYKNIIGRTAVDLLLQMKRMTKVNSATTCSSFTLPLWEVSDLLL
jgi:hypothetical protein